MQEKNVLFYTARCKSDCFNVEILICGDYAVAAPFKMPSNSLPLPIDILSLYHKEVFQMSTKFTDDEWLLIFQQRTQSGLSVRKWCDSNQISYDKYKYWEKKLLRRSDPERAVSPMDFVELPQALLPPLSLEQEQSYPFELSFHGLHLKIASHAQLSQLAGILKILQASC